MQKRKKFTRVVPEEIKIADLTILDISCGTTKCTEGFHCYSQKKPSLKKFGKERVCKECGADLIDWERVHLNDITDSDFVFEELQHEIIRHAFWHTPIESDALVKVLSHGKTKTKERAKRTVKSKIGKLTAWDGRQTPMGKDEIINYAQHATATCCRKCLEAWHNIPMEAELSTTQIDFCADLIMKYVETRIPSISESGVNLDEAKKIVHDKYN